MITIESTADTIHVHIPRAEVSSERIDQILRCIRLESAVADSKLTDATADAMAEEMKADWWAKNSRRFIPDSAAKQ